VPAPPEPSVEVGAAASGVGASLGDVVGLGLADGLGLAVGEAVGEAEAEGEEDAVGAADRAVEDDPVAVVVRGVAVALGDVVLVRGFVVRVEVTGVGLGALVAVGAGGDVRGGCPEPNRNPTTVPGAGLWLPAPALL
jgi:hypothetical protein